MLRFLINSIFIILLHTALNSYAAHSEDGRVWAEALVDVSEPYVQQTIIYTVRVTSTAQVKILSPTAPMLPGVALLEKLDPQAHFYTQQHQGTTYSISEFRYALTPLAFGQNRITPASVNVTYSEYAYAPYLSNMPNAPVKKISLQTNSIELYVKPPAAGSQGEWLPLLALNLEVKLDKTPQLNIGEPFSLTLTTNALGITGAQLHTPQLPINPDDFKIYSERPQFGQRLVRNDSVLQGWRRDTYTLIPKRAGSLPIAELRMHWWSLREARSAWATWQPHSISVFDARQASHPADSARHSDTSAEANNSPSSTSARAGFSWFWWLLSHVSLLAAGWWLGAGRPGKQRMYEFALATSRWSRRTGQALGQKMRAYGRNISWLTAYREKLKARWQAVPKWWRDASHNAPDRLPAELTVAAQDADNIALPALYPQSWWRKLLWRITPAPLRALQFLRAIDNETEPLRLSGLIQQFAHEQFKTPRNTPLLRLSCCFAEHCPRMNAVALQRLFKALDQLRYDRPSQFKLREWKAEFQRVLQYLPLRQAKPAKWQRQKLPELNPV